MSASAAPIRKLLSEALAERIPGALEPRVWTERERVPCGVEAIDALLGGGLPVGAISELVGPECSGRTTAALGMVAALTQAGKVCAWVDVSDSLDPEAAAAAGVDLSRLLWVRCGGPTEAAQPAVKVEVRSSVLEGLAQTGKPVAPGHCGAGHPRNETRGMPQALEELLLQTPRSPVAAKADKLQKGLSARGRAVARKEGWTDPAAHRLGEARARLLSRVYGGQQPAHGSEVREAVQPALPVMEAEKPKARRRERWSTKDGGALDQALRAADLLLMNGGFAVLVLDLGSTPAEFAWRVPLATWFRYRAACDRTRTSLVLLTQQACAKSSAEAVVKLRVGEMENEGPVMTGMRYEAELERQRFAREPARRAEKVVPICKPPQSERAGMWRRAMTWVRGAR